MQSGLPLIRSIRFAAAVQDANIADRRRALPISLAPQFVPEFVSPGEDELLDGAYCRVRQYAARLDPALSPGQCHEPRYLTLADAEDSADFGLVVSLAVQVRGRLGLRGHVTRPAAFRSAHGASHPIKNSYSLYNFIIISIHFT